MKDVLRLYLEVQVLTCCCQGNEPLQSFFKEFSLCTPLNEAKLLFVHIAGRGSLIRLIIVCMVQRLSNKTQFRCVENDEGSNY